MLSVKKLLAKMLTELIALDNKVKYLPRIDGSYKATVANSWEKTGTGFTVPANHIYLARAQLGFQSARPVGVGFNNATTIGAVGVPTVYFADSAGVSISPCFFLFSGTYYLFEKRAAIPSVKENHYINILDITYA